ncbi:MAG TPA: helix-hairpin-helix domain-containing protein [Fibrobacteraceae bacterium]|jgi:competence ComEA-like helix-hairpin-helix protein|nr:helix-hairpin-helix domain-containing protein [Fibrobacter sp.]HPW94200.1 helix-hairpin-helix domain-containing protein [Fibrobacteraceae bacterium]
MNKSEKKALLLFLVLFGIGFLIRLLPIEPVPAIEEFSVEEKESLLEGEVKDVKESVVENKKVSFPVKKTKKKAEIKFPISINKATLEELCALKGVGPKLAEKMIAYRDSVGGFKTASDLLKVPGIGKKKSKNILHDVIFD